MVGHHRNRIASRATAQRGPAVTLARGLGWFRIGLRLIEAFVPRVITGWLGMRGQEPIVRTYGVREIGKGIGILPSKDPALWIWGRVAGDILDLATVAPHLRGGHPDKDNVVRALAALVGVTIVDVSWAVRLGAGSG